MGALGDAAIQVNQSWCKTDLRQAKLADEEGDRFCAAGALMNNLLIEHGLYLDWNLPAIGTKKELAAIREKLKQVDAEDHWDGTQREDVADMTIYKYLNRTKEAKFLAEVIVENFKTRLDEEFSFSYPDRDNTYVDQKLEEKDYATIIFCFNDNDETTREEVIAMMEKAELKMQEKGDFEDEEEKVSEAA